MGDALPFVDLGAGRHPVQIAAGHSHVCAVLDDGSVKCFGSNSYRACGQPTDSTNTGFGNEPGEMGDDLPSVDLGEGRTAVQICANVAYSCVIDDLGGLRCWGNHPGRGDLMYAPDSVNVGSDTGAVVQIACGGYNAIHMCAVFADGRVKCWGSNGGGQLGLGDTNTRGRGNTGNMGDALPYVDLGTGRTALQVTAGDIHSCALLDNLQVKCWGNAAYGQLGYGDTIQRGSGPGDMGDQLPYVNLTGNAPGVTIVSHVNVPWSAIFPPPLPSPPPPPPPSPPPPPVAPPPPPSPPPPPAAPPPPPSYQESQQGDEQDAPAGGVKQTPAEKSSGGSLSVGGAVAVGFACGFFTVCGILGAMAVRRYLQRYSDQSGLPMTIKTKMAKKNDGSAQPHTGTGMNAKQYMSTVNPLSRG